MKTPASFSRAIKIALEKSDFCYIKHHQGDRIRVVEAKPLGFGSGAVMVRAFKGGWISVCPLTWEIES